MPDLLTPALPTSVTATVDGRRVAWRATGSGAPALFLHCMLAHSGAFAGVMERLADRLAIRALDLPGHGGTDHDPARGYQDQAVADALALLAASGPAHLVGHSFGGTVALRVAVEAQHLVRSLVLIEPVMFGFLADAGDHAGYAREQDVHAPVRAAAARGDWKAAAEAFLGRWGSLPLPPRQRDYILARLPMIAASERDVYDEPGRVLHLRDLAGICVPVVLLAGASSPESARAILDAIAGALPQARRSTVPGAGHMLPVTHPDAVAAAIRDALAGAGKD